jgi:hypothetical protein
VPRDYQRELENILDAVGPARRQDGAYVRVLNWGSRTAIGAAPAQERSMSRTSPATSRPAG